MRGHAGNLAHGPLDKLQVVFQRERRVDSPLKEYRRHTLCGGLPEFADHRVDRMCVRALLAGMPVERAEYTVDIANVRVVRVGVHVERHAPPRVLHEPDLIGRSAQIQELRMEKEIQTLLA
jgi:hypothetical protein